MVQLESIIKKGESEKVEFKASFVDEAIESLVAFANTRGGDVYIGVSDKGKILGLELGKETIQGWINEIKHKTVPSVIPDVELFSSNNKTVIRLGIMEYPIKPVSFKGRYFKRVGNANHTMAVGEVANLHLQSLNTSWDSYPSTYNLSDIDEEKVRLAIDRMLGNGLTLQNDMITFLHKNDLIREQKLTHAAYLLFKKKDSIETTIEMGRFQDAITIKDTFRTKSDIITQVEQVLEFIKKHINKKVIITGEPRNTQKWQYPLEAVREIVMNMIVHRDYRSSADSIVKIFDNKIEFYNPGRLPDTITIADLLNNNYQSTPRNKLLADVFKNIGHIEKYGSGIQRILNYFKQEGLPMPDFRNISEGFMVTVFDNEEQAKVVDRVVEKVVDRVVDSLTEHQRNIISSILANPKISAREISEIIGLSHRKTQENIKKLKDKGKLKRIGFAKGGYWELME